jgi:thymidine phosphorylase
VESDRINPAVGLTDVAQLGAKIEAGQPLATVHAATEDDAERAARAVLAAVTIGDAPQLPPLMIEKVS